MKLKVVELKDKLKDVQRPVYGTKVVLVQRLLEFKEEKDSQLLLTSDLQLIHDKSTSKPSASQTFSLERIDHNISDIEEEEKSIDSDINKNARQTSNRIKLKRYNNYWILLFIIKIGSYKYWTHIETFDNEHLALNKMESEEWKFRRNYIESLFF